MQHCNTVEKRCNHASDNGNETSTQRGKRGNNASEYPSCVEHFLYHSNTLGLLVPVEDEGPGILG